MHSLQQMMNPQPPAHSIISSKIFIISVYFRFNFKSDNPLISINHSKRNSFHFSQATVSTYFSCVIQLELALVRMAVDSSIITSHGPSNDNNKTNWQRQRIKLCCYRGACSYIRNYWKYGFLNVFNISNIYIKWHSVNRNNAPKKQKQITEIKSNQSYK